MSIKLNIEGTEKTYPRGVTVGAVLSQLGRSSTFPPLGAFVDGRLEFHDFVLEKDCDFQPVRYNNFNGFGIYRRSAVVILLEAARRVCPELRLVIGQSLSEGYFFSLTTGRPIGSPAIFNIEGEMRKLVELDLPAIRKRLSPAVASAYYEQAGFPDKVALFRYLELPEVDLVGYGDSLELGLGPIAPSTGLIPRFALVSYGDGFVLRFPTFEELERFPTWSVDRGRLKIAVSNVKLFYLCRATRAANRRLGIGTAGDLNRAIASGGAGEAVASAERYFQRSLIRTARYVKLTEGLKTLFISGLAASGVSCVARRLAAILEGAGLPCLLVREADYGDPGHLAFLDPAGSRPATDAREFNRLLTRLRDGETIPGGAPGREPLRIPDGGILMVQVGGGLDRKRYPLMHRTASRSLFVTCLPQILLDNHNRVFSTNFRCLRWMLRGTALACRSPIDSLRSWAAVRRYENRQMLPFQNAADLIFNSTLTYEAAVLKALAGPLLEEAGKESPVRVDADRLQNFLKWFLPLDPGLVPETSVLREYFPGGCECAGDR